MPASAAAIAISACVSLGVQMSTMSINGDSTKVVQGTAGTTEEQIRYTWNYAMLIARGPSPEALVKSPIFRAMESGSLARFEEITRCASEVQDAMISLLSEKRISIPELETEVPAAKGFSIIATVLVWWSLLMLVQMILRDSNEVSPLWFLWRGLGHFGVLAIGFIFWALGTVITLPTMV